MNREERRKNNKINKGQKKKFDKNNSSKKDIYEDGSYGYAGFTGLIVNFFENRDNITSFRYWEEAQSSEEFKNAVKTIKADVQKGDCSNNKILKDFYIKDDCIANHIEFIKKVFIEDYAPISENKNCIDWIFKDIGNLMVFTAENWHQTDKKEVWILLQNVIMRLIKASVAIYCLKDYFEKINKMHDFETAEEYFIKLITIIENLAEHYKQKYNISY